MATQKQNETEMLQKIKVSLTITHSYTVAQEYLAITEITELKYSALHVSRTKCKWNFVSGSGITG